MKTRHLKPDRQTLCFGKRCGLLAAPAGLQAGLRSPSILGDGRYILPSEGAEPVAKSATTVRPSRLRAPVFRHSIIRTGVGPKVKALPDREPRSRRRFSGQIKEVIGRQRGRSLEAPGQGHRALLIRHAPIHLTPCRRRADTASKREFRQCPSAAEPRRVTVDRGRTGPSHASRRQQVLASAQDAH